MSASVDHVPSGNINSTSSPDKLSDSKLDDTLDLDYDSFDEQVDERPAERWAPLGAATSPTPGMTSEERLVYWLKVKFPFRQTV